MPKLQTITTNFTAGEFSPRLRGRVDLEKYNASAEKLENIVVLRQGGATIRPSLDYKGPIKVAAQTVRIIPFVYSRTDAYILELGEFYLRIWKSGALVESSPGVPYEVATPWTAAQVGSLDFTQGADTLILTHPSVAPQRIQRFSDTSWRVEPCPFQPGAIYEGGHRRGGITMTISAGTVGAGRTITASGSFYQPADVGRVIGWGNGLASITAFGSATSVTATVTAAFDALAAAGPAWLLEGTPQTSLTPSIDKPVGSTVTLTAAANTWRNEDNGKFVEINGGLVEIQSTDLALTATGIIRRELVGVVAAPADAWVLKGPVWNDVDGYPRTCTLFQQRLWFAGTAKFPQSEWGSQSGLFFDFTPGTDDAAAVYKTIDSDDINVIEYLVSVESLVALTFGGEYETRGGIEKPITQLNAQLSKISKWGSDAVRPEEAGKDMLVVQRGGRAIRRLKREDVAGFSMIDVSVFSEHLLADGVRSMAWEQSPEQVMWVATGAGKLLAVTYSDEQNTVAFCSGNASGFVEWLATIPDGSVDATYALVRRTINGSTVRYIERINWDAPPGQDCRKEVTGAESDTWSGFGHLAGQTVQCLADGVHVGSAVVSGAGVITLPRTATTLSAGIGYSARIRLQAPEVGTGTGTSQAQAQANNQIYVRFLNTIGCKVNGDNIGFRQFGAGILDEPIAPFTGIKQITDLGWAIGEAPIEIVQDQPYPWTVLAVVRNFTVNQG